MKKKSWRTGCRALMCIVLCFGMVFSMAACGVETENEPTVNDHQYDIVEEDYDTYIEFEDQLLSAEVNYLNSDGYVESSDIPAMFDEVEGLLRQGVADGVIERYLRDEESIYIKFASGIPYLFVPYQKGMLNTGSGCKILTVEPNKGDWSVLSSEVRAALDAWGNEFQYGGSFDPSDQARWIVEALPDIYSYDEVWFDPYDPLIITPDSLVNEEVTVERMKKLADYKIIIWEGHGIYNEETKSALVTGESFIGWEKFSRYKDDLEKDNLILTSFPTLPGTKVPYSPVRYYAITSNFVKNCMGEMDDALVFMGACSSMKDDTLATAFLEKGASVVLGYTEVTSMPYEMISRSLFFHYLVQHDGTEFPTVFDAYQKTIATIGSDYYATGPNASILRCLYRDDMASKYTLNGILEEPLIVEIPDETEPPELPEVLLIGDEQRKVNIFLSNFSEQGFGERYEWNEEKGRYAMIRSSFVTETADAMDLAEFAWQYAKLNGTGVEFVFYEGNYYYGVDVEKLSSITQRFFGRSISVTNIQISKMDNPEWYQTIVVDGQMCHPAADGETYNYMTVAEEMYDLGDGTFRVNFRIYEISDIGGDDAIVLGGGTVQDKTVYDFSVREAEAHPDFEYYLSGQAVIRPYTTEKGKDTYQLISYDLIPAEEEA